MEPQAAPLPTPSLVAVEMGYGHLRAAWPLAEELRTPVLHVDRPPLSDESEKRMWSQMRGAYEIASRLSQVPVLGRPLDGAMQSLTRIPPLHPLRDLSAPTREVKALETLAARGLGAGLIAHLRQTGTPLLTTFYSCAIVADRAGLDRVFCVVTDSDLNRIWAPLEPARTRITYLAPARRVVDRLVAYGVPRERIELTGFPLPGRLLGGRDLPALKANLAARLARLDPRGVFRAQAGGALERALGRPIPKTGEAPLLAFAVGGAGAQGGIARRFLPSVKPLIDAGRLRVALVAGVRPEVERRFLRYLRLAGLEGALGKGVEVLFAPGMAEYFTRFEDLMERADALWTKPSELTFYAALGLPVVCGPALGVHEQYNRRWLVENGAGLEQRDPRHAGAWLQEWLDEGNLAAAAWSGFLRLPKDGLYRIAERFLAG